MGAPVPEACAQLYARKYRSLESTRSPLSVLDVFSLESPQTGGEQPLSSERPRGAAPNTYGSYDDYVRRRCPLPPTGKLRGQTKGISRAFSRSSSLNDKKVLVATNLKRTPSISSPDLFTFEDHFIFEAVIGRSAMSEVYQARHRLTGELYAVKRSMRSFRSKADRERCMHEIQAVAALPAHPNIVSHYRAWQQAGHFYIQADTHAYVLSDDLLWSIAADIAEPWAKSLSYKRHPACTSAAKGLDFLHAAGVLHLDIKPDNIYIGANFAFRIGDFGIAVLRNEWVWEEGDGDYLAPELLADAQPTPAADVFSLGATLYECATGRKLPRGTGAAAQPVELPGRPPTLQHMVQRMLAPSPMARPTAREVLIAIAAAAAHGVTSAAPHTGTEAGAQGPKEDPSPSPAAWGGFRSTAPPAASATPSPVWQLGRRLPPQLHVPAASPEPCGPVPSGCAKPNRNKSPRGTPEALQPKNGALGEDLASPEPCETPKGLCEHHTTPATLHAEDRYRRQSTFHKKTRGEWPEEVTRRAGVDRPLTPAMTSCPVMTAPSCPPGGPSLEQQRWARPHAEIQRDRHQAAGTMRLFPDLASPSCGGGAERPVAASPAGAASAGCEDAGSAFTCQMQGHAGSGPEDKLPAYEGQPSSLESPHCSHQSSAAPMRGSPSNVRWAMQAQRPPQDLPPSCGGRASRPTEVSSAAASTAGTATALGCVAWPPSASSRKRTWQRSPARSPFSVVVPLASDGAEPPPGLVRYSPNSSQSMASSSSELDTTVPAAEGAPQPMPSPFSALAAAPPTPSSHATSSPALSRQGSAWNFWPPGGALTPVLGARSPLAATPQFGGRTAAAQPLGLSALSHGGEAGQCPTPGAGLQTISGGVPTAAPDPWRAAWPRAGGLLWRAPSLARSRSGGSAAEDMAVEDLRETVRQLSMSCSLGSISSSALDPDMTMSV